MRVYGNFNGTSTNPSGTSSSVFWSAFLKARGEKLSDLKVFFLSHFNRLPVIFRTNKLNVFINLGN